MTCEEIEPELVAYHFNVAGEETRQRIEAHLVECPACVLAFVALKRSIETSEDAPAPSKQARAKLRRAVAMELGVAKWSWWERPLAIALAASLVLVSGMTMHALTSTPGSAPYATTH